MPSTPAKPNWLAALKTKARQLKVEVVALSLAAADPRVPWAARVLIVCVVAYALSPLDLIPDPIPVFGMLDDLVLLPLGIALALKMIPPEVMADCRARAVQASGDRRLGWWAAGVVALVWLAAGAWLLRALFSWA